MYKLLLLCLFGLILATSLISVANSYARVTIVVVHAPFQVKVNEMVSVQAYIHTGNNQIEYVHDVEATLILPEGTNLTFGLNPAFIGEMGPGPADASYNWTILFNQFGLFMLKVNVSCVDTQTVHRWLMNFTTVEVYDIPHVEFSTHGKAYANQTVVFNATDSHACGPGGAIVCYEWDFGDGTSITSGDPVVVHEFSIVGNYTVSLNVTDNRGLSSTTATNLRIGLLGDLNWDKTINILDISFVAHSFGSRPADERWNPECDLNGDDVIDILDVALVAKEYGKTV